MYNRDSAVRHGIELVQAAGLKSGRHEQDVTASSDTVGHAHTEAHPPPALILPMLLHLSAGKAPGCRLKKQSCDQHAVFAWQQCEIIFGCSSTTKLCRRIHLVVYGLTAGKADRCEAKEAVRWPANHVCLAIPLDSIKTAKDPVLDLNFAGDVHVHIRFLTSPCLCLSDFSAGAVFCSQTAEVNMVACKVL